MRRLSRRQADQIQSDLFLGVAIAGINLLIGIGLIIVFK
jgi:hypothetical protein